MKDELKPHLDFIFKRIFGSEENKDEVLLNFINEVVKHTEPKPFTKLVLKNTHIEKDMVNDKQSILDVRAENEDGKQINIEIQVARDLDMRKRTLYYWAKMYEEQLNAGDPYGSLRKTITINILDFHLFSNDQIHNVFHLCEDHTQEVLVEDIEIHFLELVKLEREGHNISDRLIRWLTFIKGVPKEQWEALAMDTPGLRKAMDTLEFLSQSEEIRALSLAREKALRDQISLIEKGRMEGKIEGKTEMIIRLLQKNKMSIPEIAEMAGLPESEITKLKQKKQ